MCHFFSFLFFLCDFSSLIIPAFFFFKNEPCCYRPLKYVNIAIQSHSSDGNNSYIKRVEKGREDPRKGETFSHLSRCESLNTTDNRHVCFNENSTRNKLLF